MGLFDLFRRNKRPGSTKPETEKPSPEQALFADTVLEIIGPTVERFGFVRHRAEVKTYSATIVYRKGNRYIMVNSTSYPTDYPYYYNIALGEGDSEDVFEYDWNSVAVWAMARIIEPSAKVASYDFPLGENVRPSVEAANSDLVKYGDTFLRGDLTLFYEARKAVNEKREPYKIHTPDKDGVYRTTDEPKSAAQKRKYS